MVTRGPPYINRETDMTENITFPKTTYMGGTEAHPCIIRTRLSDDSEFPNNSQFTTKLLPTPGEGNVFFPHCLSTGGGSLITDPRER